MSTLAQMRADHDAHEDQPCPNRRASDYCPGCDLPWNDCTCRVPDDTDEQRDAAYGDLGVPTVGPDD